MQSRNREAKITYQGSKAAVPGNNGAPDTYDYGNIKALPVFTGTHPAVMEKRIRSMDWAQFLTH